MDGVAVERLYYDQPFLTEFSADIVRTAHEGRRVYLNRTAFYPASGGQPFDTGSLGAARVIEVVDEDSQIAHILDQPLSEGPIQAAIDWDRRFEHMQQHTGQHLLSAVLSNRFGLETASFHLGAESSTIDVSGPPLDAALIEAAEQQCNREIAANRPVTIHYENANDAAGLRKQSERTGLLRVISIDGLDRSACGGTHLSATGQIGVLLLRKVEKVKGFQRLEFLCGLRAVARSRAESDQLQRIARLYSAGWNQLAAVVEAQANRARALEKSAKEAASELAKLQAQAALRQSQAGPGGLRRFLLEVEGAITPEHRIFAQSFTGSEPAVCLASSAETGSFLLACSSNSGLKAGQVLQPALARVGGRGGGSATVAQGSAPVERFDEIRRQILSELGFPD